MRTKKALYNIVTSLLSQVVVIICGLITPRLLLVSFGSTYNGVVSSATQYLSMINILNIGITGVTRVALYKTLAAKDILGTSRIMKATKSYMRKVALCLGAYAIALSIIYPYISHNDLSNIECTVLILIVSIGTFAEYFFGLSNQTLLQAAQASYVTNALNIAKTIVNTICVAVLISIGSSIFIVKLGSSLVYFITPVIMNAYVKKKFKLIDDCKPDTTAIKNRRAAAFHTIANIIHNNTDLVVLTLFSDAKLISVYTVYYLVVGRIKSLMHVFTNGMEAAFGDMWVKHEMDILQRRFREFEFLIYSFTTIVFSCVLILIIPFIRIYTSGVTDVNYVRVPLAILITIAEAAFCIRQPYLTLVYATGSYEETKNGSLIEAMLNVIISVALVWKIGIEGVIIGTLVANIFRTVQFSIFISKKILNRTIMEVVYRNLWSIGTLGIIVIASIILFSYVSFDVTWIGWFIQALIALMLATTTTCLSALVFYRKDLNMLIDSLFSVFKRK